MTESPLLTTFIESARANGSIVRAIQVDALPDEIRLTIGQSRCTGISAALAAWVGVAAPPVDPHTVQTWISLGVGGIATTGTVVVAERDLESRLPALLCRRHVVVLPVHLLLLTLTDAAGPLRTWLSDGWRYITFVSGPSRTADIEKRLTIGAHGPAEFEVYLVEAHGQ